ncbi:RCS-specific HTH-type transcriptional activator RclR [Oerskovia enterophila]|uniref:RCS-specific HTH-type transcriptional activator RclR n=2 Tax=Oerskovia enterophila TaxID=43678 RepID=A0A163RQM8_9CELL|nr:RCS-specific HTH-type transcriptional activator RclR [Oerskovia enterophila]
MAERLDRMSVRLPSETWAAYGRDMDAVAGLLDGPRARGAFLLRSLLAPPWSMRIEDEAPLTLVPVVRGSAWLGMDAGPRPDEPSLEVYLDEGDVALVRGPRHYTVADAPGTAPQMVSDAVGACRAIGDAPSPLVDLGVRTWGNDPDGPTVLLTGTYPLDGEVGGRLLSVLPPLVVLRRGDLDADLVSLLAREVSQDRPGQEAVLDRLLDILLIGALRAWLDRGEAPGWYRADADPVVGHALRLMHHDPARAWTVESLARTVGLSRAAFSRRFTELVGEPPMGYLTGWRLTLAADLLLEPGATVGSVARQVGYGTPFALSAAFTRVRGMSPTAHRERVGAGSGAA